MSDGRSYKVTTNLSRKMAAPGGRPAAEALARAEVALESHRGGAMDQLAGDLSALEALVAVRAEGSGPQVYVAAAALLDLAGFFDAEPFCRAAFSLCDAATWMAEEGTWDWPTIVVHVRALRLILNDQCRATTATEEVLAGLQAVRKRLEARRAG